MGTPWAPAVMATNSWYHTPAARCTRSCGATIRRQWCVPWDGVGRRRRHRHPDSHSRTRESDLRHAPWLLGILLSVTGPERVRTRRAMLLQKGSELTCGLWMVYVYKMRLAASPLKRTAKPVKRDTGHKA